LSAKKAVDSWLRSVVAVVPVDEVVVPEAAPKSKLDAANR
jgi:hypothetical protein